MNATKNTENMKTSELEITFCKHVAFLMTFGMSQDEAKKEVKRLYNETLTKMGL